MKNYINNAYLLGYSLTIISIIFIILASYYHPYIGDDYLHFYEVGIHNTFAEYYKYNYNNHNGRLIQVFLEYILYKNEIVRFIFKIIVAPSFIFCSWLCWYLSTNKFIKYNNTNFWKFIIFTISIWFSLPTISETIIWTAGSTTYFWSFFVFIIYLTFSKYILENRKINHSNKIYINTLNIILSFLIGSSQEQLGFAIIILLIYYYYLNNQNINKNNKIFISISIFSALIGFIIMAVAPGNFVRLSNYDDFNFLLNFRTFILYFFSSLFKLADEDKGGLLWMSIFIIIYLINPKFEINKTQFKNSFVWILAVISCLLIMLPISATASLRTTFFSVFFLYIFIINFFKNENANYIHPFVKNFLIITFSAVLFFDSFSGFLANRSLHSESINRHNIIEKSILNKNQKVNVPFYQTMPSRLTFILNPKYQEEYLNFYTHENIKITIDKKSEPPYSLNSLKKFKFNY